MSKVDLNEIECRAREAASFTTDGFEHYRKLHRYWAVANPQAILELIEDWKNMRQALKYESIQDTHCEHKDIV
jgi:predicted acetyltransferase